MHVINHDAGHLSSQQSRLRACHSQSLGTAATELVRHRVRHPPLKLCVEDSWHIQQTGMAHLRQVAP